MKMCTPYEGEHCCADMNDFLQDYRIPIDYDPELNSYFLPFVWPYTTRQGLRYCPWCGTKVPDLVEKKLD